MHHYVLKYNFCRRRCDSRAVVCAYWRSIWYERGVQNLTKGKFGVLNYFSIFEISISSTIWFRPYLSKFVLKSKFYMKMVYCTMPIRKFENLDKRFYCNFQNLSDSPWWHLFKSRLGVPSTDNCETLFLGWPRIWWFINTFNISVARFGMA